MPALGYTCVMMKDWLYKTCKLMVWHLNFRIFAISMCWLLFPISPFPLDGIIPLEFASCELPFHWNLFRCTSHKYHTNAFTMRQIETHTETLNHDEITSLNDEAIRLSETTRNQNSFQTRDTLPLCPIWPSIKPANTNQSKMLPLITTNNYNLTETCIILRCILSTPFPVLAKRRLFQFPHVLHTQSGQASKWKATMKNDRLWWKMYALDK